MRKYEIAGLHTSFINVTDYGKQMLSCRGNLFHNEYLTVKKLALIDAFGFGEAMMDSLF